jgi:hypothetical protein
MNFYKCSLFPEQSSLDRTLASRGRRVPLSPNFTRHAVFGQRDFSRKHRSKRDELPNECRFQDANQPPAAVAFAAVNSGEEEMRPTCDAGSSGPATPVAPDRDKYKNQQLGARAGTDDSKTTSGQREHGRLGLFLCHLRLPA